jgi:hypothetical protein
MLTHIQLDLPLKLMLVDQEVSICQPKIDDIVGL